MRAALEIVSDGERGEPEALPDDDVSQDRPAEARIERLAG
jgi:hypothetical protein